MILSFRRVGAAEPRRKKFCQEEKKFTDLYHYGREVFITVNL